MLNHPEFKDYLDAHPNHILYGEWMIPHTIRSYSENVWKNFYVFDVFEYNEQSSKYISYEEYKEEVLTTFSGDLLFSEEEIASLRQLKSYSEQVQDFVQISESRVREKNGWE